MNMENTVKKTNTQLLKEIQDVVDDINKEKEEVEKRLQIIDSLEKKYYDLIEEVKQNSENK
jgi:DNA repair ATPase RecN